MPNPIWHEQLEGSLQGHEALMDFGNISDLAKSHVELVGKHKDLEGEHGILKGELESRVAIPGENATDEERATFLTKLGRPEKPDGYEFKRPELPEGFEYSEEMEGAFKNAAHEAGLTPTAASSIYNFYMDMLKTGIASEVAASKKALDDATETLRKEWGTDHDKNLEIAVRAAERIGGDELKNYLNQSGKGNDPVLIRAFHKIGTKISDDAFEPGGGGGSELSEEEKLKKIFPRSYDAMTRGQK